MIKNLIKYMIIITACSITFNKTYADNENVVNLMNNIIVSKATAIDLKNSQREARLAKFRELVKQAYSHGSLYNATFISTEGQQLDYNENEVAEAEKLRELILKFLEENKDVKDEDFYKTMDKFTDEYSKKDVNWKILNRDEFEKEINNSKLERLWVDQLIYDKDEVNRFKSGESLFCLQSKIKNVECSNRDMVTNCKRVLLEHPWGAGPYLLDIIGEVGLDLNKAKVVESNYLTKLKYILKIKYPEEFGFFNELEPYLEPSPDFFDKDHFASHLVVWWPSEIFDNRDSYYDNFYRAKINHSYFDYSFAYTKAKKQKVDELIMPYKKELDDYDNSIKIIDKDGSMYYKRYYTNKVLSALSNYNFLAALLGYEAVINYYNFGPNSNLNYLGISNSEKRAHFNLLNFKNVVICKQLEVIERDDNNDFKEFDPVILPDLMNVSLENFSTAK